MRDPREIIAHELGLQPSDLSPDDELRADLRADDLHLAGIRQRIEESTGRDVPLGVFMKWVTVADVIASVESKECCDVG